ncbi:DNA gyrase inhibitor YacG [Endozoicomonas euniceicola]|uniref:DNA gyrase inhibitor YacG n=1 Tax=Endozoicomonas euniceicola TaxID=1234143 RepID=A0ABY6GY15_9GAMM|nr:DNA gyrase inhibitor YacG [Endozoicomonas euniceicola]UYM16903.1 DNA gyrase inhibitor YacG [Endozoicomonas euniceicola]
MKEDLLLVMPTTVKCPNCNKSVEWKKENQYRPFCSERCKLIDFGAWANEEHSIPGQPDFDDAMSDELDQPGR